MPKYVVQMVNAYSGEVIETLDEVFDSEYEADNYACECGGAFSEGADVLSMSGEEYTSRDDVDFVVEEIDDDDDDDDVY